MSLSWFGVADFRYAYMARYQSSNDHTTACMYNSVPLRLFGSDLHFRERRRSLGRRGELAISTVCSALASSMTTVDSSVLILGAGVFGLSTALHLKRAGESSLVPLTTGYKSVKVLDRQPFDKNHYNPAEGWVDLSPS